MGWSLGRIAAGVGTMGGSEVYRELSKPGNILGPNDVPQIAPADPNNAQYGAGNGTELSNQLAALAQDQGAAQQGSQAEREAGFYNQANQNFDIGNAAQMRGGPQIQGSTLDQSRQLAALGGTNAAMGNVNQVGSQLQALGTRPMGASYAEAQLQQGLAGGMAQQLSMARSGRSLGSGQAAMNSAAFNNAALSQQANQAAAGARIQEQNAYNQFQAGALAAAGQQFGQGGALAGQAGGQATTIRTGNEGLQAQNAALNQSQQQINNQTTGLYNSLGAQQQGLGMQANQMGQQAGQFGQQRSDNIMGAQLQANTGLNGTNAQINMANNATENASQTAQKAATLQLAGSALGAGAAASDERAKTNIMPLELPKIEVGPGGSWVPAGTRAPESLRSDSTSSAYGTTPMASSFAPAINPDGSPAQGMQHAADFANPRQAGMDYMEHIRALQNRSTSELHAPVDVLNRVPGAGAGPSASQSALMAHFAQPAGGAPRPAYAAPVREYMAGGPAGFATAAPSTTGGLVGGARPASMLTSDEHSKTRIRDLETQLAALSADAPPQAQPPPSASFAPQQPDTAALDEAYASQGGAPRPAVDLTAARGYAYDYKDPNMPGAAPGRHVGPMAQDLEHTAAAGTVHDTAAGKQVDTKRLTMVNTAALSEQQRKMQELERQMAALQGSGLGDYAEHDQSMYPGQY